MEPRSPTLQADSLLAESPGKIFLIFYFFKQFVNIRIIYSFEVEYSTDVNHLSMIFWGEEVLVISLRSLMIFALLVFSVFFEVVLAKKYLPRKPCLLPIQILA